MSVCLCICVPVCLCTFIMSMYSVELGREQNSEGLETTPKPFGNVVLPNGQFQCTVKTRQLGAKAASKYCIQHFVTTMQCVAEG